MGFVFELDVTLWVMNEMKLQKKLHSGRYLEIKLVFPEENDD